MNFGVGMYRTDETERQGVIICDVESDLLVMDWEAQRTDCSTALRNILKSSL